MLASTRAVPMGTCEDHDDEHGGADDAGKDVCYEVLMQRIGNAFGAASIYRYVDALAASTPEDVRAAVREAAGGLASRLANT